MNNPVRVLVVLHDFSLGGSERVAIRLASAWARRASVTILCRSTRGPLLALVSRAVEIVVDHDSRDLGSGAARYLQLHPADVCFLPGNTYWPVASVLASPFVRHRPITVAKISTALRKSRRSPLRQHLFDARMRWLLRRIDAVVALDEEIAGEATQILRRDVVRFIPSPALEDNAPAPVAMPQGRQITAIGRLVPEKGFPILLDALAQLDHSIRLILVGCGPEESRLREHAAMLGLSGRVDFAGYRNEVRPILDQSRLLVVSSEFEGFPSVMVEALAAGRPVVATACSPGIVALLSDRRLGRVVPVGDPVAMAAAIAELLGGPAASPEVFCQAVSAYRLHGVADTYFTLFNRLMRK